MSVGKSCEDLLSVNDVPITDTPIGTVDIASYVATMIQGLRQLTGQQSYQDLELLDRMLETAGEEAVKVAARSLN